MDDVDRELAGAVLQQTRKAAGLSQFDVAEALSVSQGTVSLIETGKMDVRVGELTRFAELVEIPLQTLMRRMGLPVEPGPVSFEEWYRQRRHSLARLGGTRATQKRAMPSHEPPESGLPYMYPGRHAVPALAYR